MNGTMDIFKMSNEELYEMGPPVLKVKIEDTEPFGMALGTSYKVDYEPEPIGVPLEYKHNLPGFDNVDSHHSVPEIEARFNKEAREQNAYDSALREFGTNFIYGSDEQSNLNKLLAGVDLLAKQMNMNQNQIDALKAKIYESYIMEHMSIPDIRKQLNLPETGVAPSTRPDDFSSPEPPIQAREPFEVPTGTGDTVPTANPGAAETPTRKQPGDELLEKVGDDSKKEPVGTGAGESSQERTDESKILLEFKRDIPVIYFTNFTKALNDAQYTFIQDNFSSTTGKVLRKTSFDKKFKGLTYSEGKPRQINGYRPTMKSIIELIETVSENDIEWGKTINSNKELNIVRWFFNTAIEDRNKPSGGAASG